MAGVVDRPCRSGPFVALASGRSSAGPESPLGETPVIEVVMSTASDRKESTEMSAQQQMLWPSDTGLLSSALVVLMAILAMLGVVAHAAAA